MEYAAYCYKAMTAERAAANNGNENNTTEVESGIASLTEACEETSFQWSSRSIKFLINNRLQYEGKFTRPNCKKRKLWGSIASEMAKEGYEVSGEICDAKYRNLLQTYRKNKKKQSSTGESSITWEYFSTFDEVLGCKASSHPQETLLGGSFQLETEATPSTSSAEETNLREGDATPQTKGNNVVQKRTRTKSLTRGEYYFEKIEFMKRQEALRTKEKEIELQFKKEQHQQKMELLKIIAENLIKENKNCNCK